MGGSFSTVETVFTLNFKQNICSICGLGEQGGDFLNCVLSQTQLGSWLSGPGTLFSSGGELASFLFILPHIGSFEQWPNSPISLSQQPDRPPWKEVPAAE